MCKMGAWVYQDYLLQEMWNLLTQPYSMVRNGSSSKTQLLHRSQNGSGVAEEDPSGLYQNPELAVSFARLKPPGL